jgi:aspartyl-tRNA(Asn)/glutamyl-tRNA(Gln) amidotransferase subunit A
MTNDLPLTIAEAAAALRDGSISAVGLTSMVLDRIGSLNDQLGAYVTVCGEAALEAAEVADQDLAAGVDRGSLQGMPLAVKDIIATADAPTLCNSLITDGGWAPGIDAPVVTRLRGAGAVIVGKATTSEFATGWPDPDKGFPTPRNPWNLEHTPAGSSSGTGIAVAAGLALGGLGTDTGGSVRGPAAVNGHTGLKTTYGLVPKNGVAPLGYSLDSVGPMARSAADCAALLQVIAGHDRGDPSTPRRDVPGYADELTGSVAGLRVGVPRPYFYDHPELDDEVRAAVLAAVDVLRGLGAEVVDTAVPHAKEAKDACMITSGGEAFAYHRADLLERWDRYGRHTRMSIGRGALFGGADFAQAQRFRSHFRREVSRVMADLDVLITPTMPGPAGRIEAMAAETSLLGPSFTAPWSLIGVPAAAVPCGFTSTGLPASMQVVGKPFADGTVLRCADAYQRVTDLHLRTPPLALGVPA